MPIASTNDLVVGVDFTGISPINGGDLNNGVDLAVPQLNGADENTGVGFDIVTTDTLLDNPDVPDASVTVKWKRYTWVRRPFAGAAIKASKDYTWNEDAVNDATFLKWVERIVDLTTVTALANNALSTAENAVAVADVANLNSAAATVTANDASAAATAATTTANAANTNANTAITNAALAQATANNGVTIGNANSAAITTINAKTILNYGTALQEPRVNSAGNNVEWYNPKNNYNKFTETQAKGTDAGGSAGGKNVRVLNTTDFGGAIMTLNPASGVITFLVAGTYKISAWATMFDNSNNTHQLILVNAASNTTILTGSSHTFVAGGSTSQQSHVEGLVTAIIGDTVRLDHYITNAQAANGLGQAANIHPDAGGREVYSGIELTLLGA